MLAGCACWPVGPGGKRGAASDPPCPSAAPHQRASWHALPLPPRLRSQGAHQGLGYRAPGGGRHRGQLGWAGWAAPTMARRPLSCHVCSQPAAVHSATLGIIALSCTLGTLALSWRHASNRLLPMQRCWSTRPTWACLPCWWGRSLPPTCRTPRWGRGGGGCASRGAFPHGCLRPSDGGRGWPPPPCWPGTHRSPPPRPAPLPPSHPPLRTTQSRVFAWADRMLAAPPGGAHPADRGPPKAAVAHAALTNLLRCNAELAPVFVDRSYSPDRRVAAGYFQVRGARPRGCTHTQPVQGCARELAARGTRACRVRAGRGLHGACDRSPAPWPPPGADRGVRAARTAATGACGRQPGPAHDRGRTAGGAGLGAGASSRSTRAPQACTAAGAAWEPACLSRALPAHPSHPFAPGPCTRPQVRDAARSLLGLLARRAWGRESRYRCAGGRAGGRLSALHWKCGSGSGVAPLSFQRIHSAQ